MFLRSPSSFFVNSGVSDSFFDNLDASASVCFSATSVASLMWVSMWVLLGALPVGLISGECSDVFLGFGLEDFYS